VVPVTLDGGRLRYVYARTAEVTSQQ
jgi:hypothetical protein